MDTTIKSKYARGSKKYRDEVSGNVDRLRAFTPKDIPGWGIDADPENDPTYPMKRWTGADHQRIHYERPPQQLSNVEILQTIERPNITAVFGTSVPPSGLSCAIRRFAYKFSEADARHWLTLIFADRVNVVEGLIDDLKKGIIPNVFVERGLMADWKYDRKATEKRLVVKTTVVAVAVVALLVYKNKIKRTRLLK